MKKILTLFIIISLFLCGCSSTQKKDGYTFTDDLGRTVTVSEYARTAPLIGSFAELWTLAGGSICASADDAWDDYDIDIPEEAVNLGGTENLSLEKLLSAQPDFVIASAKRKQHIEWLEILESAGITVAYFDVSDFESYLEMLKICTDITGRYDLYEKNGLEVKKQIENTVKNAGGQTYLLLRASATYIRTKKSSGTVLGEMLSDFECINIADSDETLLENLSLESIIEKNPDRIFIVQAGDDYDGMKRAVESMFNENPAWYELDAVKNGHVHYMDKKLYNFKPNALWGTAYERLEKILFE
ncbi:MAG: ABC transporter substrate-binding protein [Clostridia bacterium]|nr:ABC transporter substrate-binding protein [Clostridia bacterium]